jgi:hypothetical protein
MCNQVINQSTAIVRSVDDWSIDWVLKRESKLSEIIELIDDIINHSQNLWNSMDVCNEFASFDFDFIETKPRLFITINSIDWLWLIQCSYVHCSSSSIVLTDVAPCWSFDHPTTVLSLTTDQTRNNRSSTIPGHLTL